MMMPQQNPNSHTGETTKRGVVFSVPTATAGAEAHAPAGPEPDPEDSGAPAYSVVIHRGRPVFYVRTDLVAEYHPDAAQPPAGG